MPSENPTDQLSISVEGGDVLLHMPGAAVRRLPPDMADHLAQQLAEAAERARDETGSRSRPKRPFPPAELVSPHAAG